MELTYGQKQANALLIQYKRWERSDPKCDALTAQLAGALAGTVEILRNEVQRVREQNNELRRQIQDGRNQAVRQQRQLHTQAGESV